MASAVVKVVLLGCTLAPAAFLVLIGSSFLFAAHVPGARSRSFIVLLPIYGVQWMFAALVGVVAWFLYRLASERARDAGKTPPMLLRWFIRRFTGGVVPDPSRTPKVLTLASPLLTRLLGYALTAVWAVLLAVNVMMFSGFLTRAAASSSRSGLSLILVFLNGPIIMWELLMTLLYFRIKKRDRIAAAAPEPTDPSTAGDVKA
ncbi:hypothetical protein HY480_01360 [Candidatus Uhrbacteria bacterium]|nr:hypothetical protein [Candidatus Uhrbacteria bacterium]